MALVIAAARAVHLAGSRIQRIPLINRTIAIVDALGLGDSPSPDCRSPWPPRSARPRPRSWGLSTPSAAACCGVLRDLFVRRDPAMFRPGPPAALAALAGSIIYLGLRQAPEVADIVAGTISVIAVFLIRIAALRYEWQTRAPRGFAGSADSDPYQG